MSEGQAISSLIVHRSLLIGILACKCRHKLRDELQINGGSFTLAVSQIIADTLPFIEGHETGRFKRRHMHEHVVSTAIGLNETETLRRVIPLHYTSSHFELLEIT